MTISIPVAAGAAVDFDRPSMSNLTLHGVLPVGRHTANLAEVQEYCRPFLEAAKQQPRAEQAVDNIVALMFQSESR